MLSRTAQQEILAQALDNTTPSVDFQRRVTEELTVYTRPQN